MKTKGILIALILLISSSFIMGQVLPDFSQVNTKLGTESSNIFTTLKYALSLICAVGFVWVAIEFKQQKPNARNHAVSLGVVVLITIIFTVFFN